MADRVQAPNNAQNARPRPSSPHGTGDPRDPDLVRALACSPAKVPPETTGRRGRVVGSKIAGQSQCACLLLVSTAAKTVSGVYGRLAATTDLHKRERNSVRRYRTGSPAGSAAISACKLLQRSSPQPLSSSSPQRRR